jgi:hypothetical protein
MDGAWPARRAWGPPPSTAITFTVATGTAPACSRCHPWPSAHLVSLSCCHCLDRTLVATGLGLAAGGGAKADRRWVRRLWRAGAHGQDGCELLLQLEHLCRAVRAGRQAGRQSIRQAGRQGGLEGGGNPFLGAMLANVMRIKCVWPKQAHCCWYARRRFACAVRYAACVGLSVRCCMR